MATAHLLEQGLSRLAYFGESNVANTVDARIAGFHEALRNFQIRPEQDPVWRGSPLDEAFVRRLLDTLRPEGIVCANDITAARLMQMLMGMGVRIPEDVRIVGMDDVKYASLLPVPLTTIHQDCAGIGSAAMATMLERIEHPELPIRDVLVPTRLVVRRSCGAHLGQGSANAEI
jgi:DNA-binding LacI/PurR family transcriptional regulator